MAAPGYVNISVPEKLTEQIDTIVANQTNGYRSRNEACVDAIRRFVRNFKNNRTLTNKNNNDGGGNGASD